MNLNLTGLDEKQQAAALQILHFLDVQQSESGTSVHFEQGGQGIQVLYDGHQASVQYAAHHHFIRALGLAIEGIKDGKAFETKETPIYESLSVMIDCSRNAVLHFDAFQALIKHLALMGYSEVQLYTEDTYEIEGYPYFGYMRGSYTAEQLKAMDRHAAMFGIELVPCIQTLAHLKQVLKWKTHASIVDYDDILLIDEPKTYELIDAMFRTMSENLTSRKINIGMDEAHMMGLGKYLDKHGYQDRSSLMLKHFGKVMEIARRYGYQPMMWSDMFFRLASGGDYYDLTSPISPEVTDMIPDDITMVYWDYYSEDPHVYDSMMKRHKQLTDKLIFAGGAWKWMGFSPNNRFSRHIGLMAHDSCVTNGVNEVLLTMWGDNGGECSVYAVLPTLQLWAELCYANNSDEDYLRKRFRTCTLGNYDDFMNLDIANLTPDNPAPGRRIGNQVNPPKYLLYQDIMCGLFDKHVIPEVYAEHYRQSAEILREAAGRNPDWQILFDTQAALCSILELKCDVGLQIRSAYLEQDRETLAQIHKDILPELRRRIEHFITVYRKAWNKENKIFGFDVFEIRIGALLQRTDSASYRINQYLSGEVANLEELEEEILYYDGRQEEGEQHTIDVALWHTIATTSVIAGV